MEVVNNHEQGWPTTVATPKAAYLPPILTRMAIGNDLSRVLGGVKPPDTSRSMWPLTPRHIFELPPQVDRFTLFWDLKPIKP
ncbi:hypothetical protein TWF718_009936 [Orbilia javanica]|uniref:Uncharacterized protein n=1 Tax=Orbilia javanica TaxID=47235 RepID=A0AAN8RBT5_9PEZI